VGNPDLQPEYATNMEVGASYSTAWGQSVSGSKESWKSKITVDAAVYRRNTTNMIDWVRSTTIPLDPWMPVNLSSVIFTGFESNIQYEWNGDGKFRINVLSLGYNYTDANHQFVDPLQASQSRYAFSGLRNQLVGRITANLTRWVAVSVAYRGVDRVGGNAYSLLDAKISGYLNHIFTVFIEGNNLWNTDYVEAGYVQMPGRWLKAGVQVKAFYSRHNKGRQNFMKFLEGIYYAD
jgi:iron complex outermembrane receptor protein